MPNSSNIESFIKRLTEIIIVKIKNEQFGVNMLASEVGMSRSNLHRRVKAYTGKSVSSFICDVRLDYATQLLNESSNSISEIAFECGFHSPTYFSKCFKDRYGFTPGEARNHLNEDGRLDTPQHKIKHMLSGKRKISLLLFLATLITIVLLSITVKNWRPSIGKTIPKDKSIAVLPFINDSPEESEMYFINGTMEAILNNLNKIEDLRVISRTTVEQYRNHHHAIPEIAKELGVSYILEGSGQKYGKRMHLTVQLLDAITDTPVWSEEYDLKINHIEDLFELQNEIAMMVVDKIHAEVSPEEMRRMRKIPTTSEMAYEFLLKGTENLAAFYAGDASSDLLTTAETLYRYALEHDPTFGITYRQIALIYYTRFLSTHGKSEYWDSIRINLDHALKFDPEDATAYDLYGSYYRNRGNWNKAIKYYNLALDYNPNSQGIYAHIGELYANKNDFVNALKNLHQSESHPQPIEKSYVDYASKMIYLWAGFKEQYNNYAKNTLKNTGDTARYYCDLATAEYWIDDNRPKALELLEKSYRIDSLALETLKMLGEVYLNDGQISHALDFYKKYQFRLDELDRIDLYGTHNIGMVYWFSGDKEKAEHYFDLQISYCNDILSGIPDSNGQLASIYAFKGDRNQAYKHLHEFNKQAGMRIYVKNGFREDNPFFASIEDDPEYQSIRTEILAKYETEHDRVRKWLEENDML